MFRRFSFAILWVVAACGDSSDDKEPVDAGVTDSGSGSGQTSKDAGTSTDKPADSGTTSTAKPDQVTNVGTACSTAANCEGDKPICQTVISLAGQAVPFGGGYCTADCNEDVECGEGGECPVGAVLRDLGAAAVLVRAYAPSNCYLSCTKDEDCRMAEGYRCTTIAKALEEGSGAQTSLLSMLLSGPIVTNKVCLPPAPELPEAGAGVTDAGTSDAGAADSGSAQDASGDAG